MTALLERLQFPEKSAEFVSQYSLPETILRLRDAVSPSNPFSFKRTMNGGFDGTKVILNCIPPFASNPCAPIFTGSIHEDARGVVLSGRFAVKRWAVIYRNVGLVFAAFFAVVFALAAFTQPRTMWPAPFVATGILMLLYGQARFTYRRAFEDVIWLSRQIGRTIENPAAWPEPAPSPVGWLRRQFTTLSGQ